MKQTVYDIFPQIDDHRVPEHFPDITDSFFWETYDKCKSHSLLGIDAFYNLFRSIEYIAKNGIEGDIVECGVFLGGAILAMSDFAFHFGLKSPRFVLCDTFSGFPDNTSEVDMHGVETKFVAHDNFLEVVKSVVEKSLYPQEKFEFVVGKVEDTLRRNKPSSICLLRLDTDYYESTRVELEELYPLLSSGGVLVVDDYGLFQGARRATDEYLQKQETQCLLMRINYSVRCGVKI
jgi:O-methyltransferase